MLNRLKNYAWEATKLAGTFLDIEYRLDALKTPTARVNKNTLEHIRFLLKRTLEIASDLGLETTKSQIISAQIAFSAKHQDLQYSITGVQIVRTTFVAELKSRKFLPASSDLIEYVGKVIPFGKQTAEVFPQCSEDIDEAHKCFAFGRYTACVFHIGRVMELAVKRLAKKMRAKATRDEWQSYITAMHLVINQMPFKTVPQKAKRALYSAATNYLFNFKEAWRNPTMHPKKTYTRDEALEVLGNARSFLQHVSTEIF